MFVLFDFLVQIYEIFINVFWKNALLFEIRRVSEKKKSEDFFRLF